MLADDVYKSRLRSNIVALETWLAGLRDMAAIDVEGDDASWRAAVSPGLREACPFELVLRTDQKFDLSVGREAYEDLAVASLELLPPLLVAITQGRVVTRTWATAATATPVRIETIITPATGSPWIAARALRALASNDGGGLVMRDRHYVPYARGA